jgi:hypothetical protein
VPKFKAKAEPLRVLPNLPNSEDVARFAAGAGTRTVEPKDTASHESRPWEELDKEAKPLSGINLRLNAYEHELLKFLAESDQRSIQQTIKRLLIPAAESAAASLQGESGGNENPHRGAS